MFPSTSPTSPPASATRKHQTANARSSTASDDRRGESPPGWRYWSRGRPAVRPGGRGPAPHPHRRPCARGAARGAPAPADVRGGRRPAAPARRGHGAAARARRRAPALDDPLRPAGHRQDDARPPRRGHGERRLRGAVGGRGRTRRGARGARARVASPQVLRRADDLLPRRDPPLQQGAAGHAAAGGRGGARDAHRGDDREPVLRGQRRAAVAQPGLRAQEPERRRRRGAAAARARARRAGRCDGRRRRARLPRRPRRRRRPHGARRARARGRDRRRTGA